MPKTAIEFLAALRHPDKMRVDKDDHLRMSDVKLAADCIAFVRDHGGWRAHALAARIKEMEHD